MTEADWSRKVKERYYFRCALCNEPAAESHHIFKKHYAHMRHDLDNGIALCAAHHAMDDTHPAQLQKLIENKIGKEAMEKLRRRAFQPTSPQT